MRAIVTGTIVGIIAYLFSGYFILFHEHRPLSVLLPLLFIILIPPIAIFLGIIPTLLFSIYISDEWIEHRFLDKFIVSKFKISDFVSITAPSGAFAAVLHFSNGKCMRFFGAHYAVIGALTSRLANTA